MGKKALGGETLAQSHILGGEVAEQGVRHRYSDFEELLHRTTALQCE